MNLERIYTVLLAPHVSEKAASSIDNSNQYVFKVALKANKLEIKRSIEQLFNVKINKIQVLKVKGKSKRNRYGISKRSDWKKAIVRLIEGQEINFSEGT